MVYYGIEFTDKEKAAIKAVKELCKKKGIKIPNTEQEICRFLHKKGLDAHQKALDACID